MSPADTIRKKALALPLSERAKLARDLLESIEEGPADPDAEEAWAKELEERVERLRRGDEKTVSGKQAIAWARARLKRRSR